MSPFSNIPLSVSIKILSLLDVKDARALARHQLPRSHPRPRPKHDPHPTISDRNPICSGFIHAQNPVPQNSNSQMLAFTNWPGGSSTDTCTRSEFDSYTSSDTELTSSDEDDCVFQLTDDLRHRLEQLPKPPTNTKAALTTLPTELHLEIFSYLDKIDCCCLGLASQRTYLIYRSIFGVRMPLNTRRQGPNPLERAWELVGKHECPQCGIYRCELHQHIKSWMPKELEYCAFKGMFGTKAADGSADNCFRGKPSKPRCCGRHPLRTTTVHQDDSMALTKLG